MTPLALRRQNEEVYYAEGDVVRIGADELAFVRRAAAVSPRRRARICAHPQPGDRLHEMVIALARDGYIRPHKHLRRAESFQVFEGSAEVVVFDDAGTVTDVVAMSSDGVRMYRLNAPRFHTVLVRSECFVVHETTEGPFDPSDTEFARWAPAETDATAAAAYAADLERRVLEFRSSGVR